MRILSLILTALLVVRAAARIDTENSCATGLATDSKRGSVASPHLMKWHNHPIAL
ncbi:hypothetical protein ACERZ8_03990 [Tateyamaria armeniaca]|uniref:Uncharacterized protein n=1 Tax=Tateyamaria armeniaca TaxID=2518930 RepID=A0ABW8UPL5_9RHOB